MKTLLLALLFLAPLAADEVVEQKLQAFMQEADIPGMAVVIVRKGKTEIYTLGWADREKRKPVDSHTIFNLASVTKVFVTTALAVQVLQGHMQLNQPAKNYIPELRQGPMRSFEGVRIVDLASHTASLPRDPPLKLKGGKYPRKAILRYLREWDAPYPVGSKYEYSNMSFGILGMTLHGVTERPLEEVFRETIFAPLGMRETALEEPPQLQSERAKGYLKSGSPAKHFQPNLWPGGGSLNSSAQDMEKFLMANMGLIGPTWLIEAMVLAQRPVFKSNERLSLGLAWQNFQSEGFHIIDKDGGVGAYSSYIGFTADKKFGVVLLSNKGRAKIPAFGRKLLESITSKSSTEKE